MTWTEQLSDKQNKLLINDICPACETKSLEQVSPSGRTVNCPKCNGAYIKPMEQTETEDECSKIGISVNVRPRADGL